MLWGMHFSKLDTMEKSSKKLGGKQAATRRTIENQERETFQ